MSGYPNVWKKWCPPGTGRQACINTYFPSSLNGILGRGSTAPAAQNYPIASVQTNLRWNERSNATAIDRRRLRKAANNISFVNGTNFSPVTENFHQSLPMGLQLGGQTPFRAMMNAGDPNLSHNSDIAGPDIFGGGLNPLYTRAHNQVSSTRRASNAGWRGLAGSVHTKGNSLWSGNSKFVYDGSDYVTFKKLQAKNRSYNDPTFGGDQHNASQVARARVRH